MDGEFLSAKVTDAWLVNAQQKNSDYLLALEPERLLYEWYRVAQMQPKTTSGYAGWERSDEVNFRGHFFGHYLSALAFMAEQSGYSMGVVQVGQLQFRPYYEVYQERYALYLPIKDGQRDSQSQRQSICITTFDGNNSEYAHHLKTDGSQLTVIEGRTARKILPNGFVSYDFILPEWVDRLELVTEPAESRVTIMNLDSGKQLPINWQESKEGKCYWQMMEQTSNIRLILRAVETSYYVMGIRFY